MDGKGFTTDDKLVMGPSLLGSSRVNGHPGLSISTVLYGLDGKIATRYSTGGSQKKGMWLMVELPEAREVSGVLFNNTGSRNDGAKKYEISASMDGEAWVPVLANAKTVKSINEVLFSKAVRAKFFKFALTENGEQYNWSIHDLQLYGR